MFFAIFQTFWIFFVMLTTFRIFVECTRFRDVKLPSTLKVIEYDAFFGCKNIEPVTIGRELDHIDPRAFVGCDSLKSFDVDDDNEHFTDDSGVLYSLSGNILYRVPSNYKETSFKIRNGVQIIAPHAFDGCKDIRNVVFPESLLLIGESAFSGCEDLEQVLLPESVLRIESCAFRNCKSVWVTFKRATIQPYNPTSSPLNPTTSKDNGAQKLKRFFSIIGENGANLKMLMEGMHLRDRKSFVNNYINPNLSEGYIAMLYPEIPNHPMQSYYLTNKGRKLLEQL